MSSDARLSRDPRKAATSATLATPQPPPPPPPANVSQQSVAVSTGAKPVNGVEKHDEEENVDKFALRFCTVCASNQNRSMEGHLRLAAANFPVISFGTGSLVRLPGPSISQPNVYPFNVTSYDTMYTELQEKDPRLYKQNGILNMLERNRGIKFGPERWQDWAVGRPRLDKYSTDKGSKGSESGVVDIVLTCEERCWDTVVDNLLDRGSPLNKPVHVINVDIKDNHEEALVGGRGILALAEALNDAAREEREKSGNSGWTNGAGPARDGFDKRVPEVLADWQDKFPGLPAIWTLAWF